MLSYPAYEERLVVCPVFIFLLGEAKGRVGEIGGEGFDRVREGGAGIA